ncbi:hypothetical protein GCM10022255_031740 [Dactylosporangium darangshiense]|uniref:Protein kinase domain-containing protein n=1 Tax=Dactylosporangium darangshiense TaxID=579108 RepID=A0ABP8D779_9ACTN
MTAQPLARADLGALGPQLGKGGQAVVYEAPGLRLPDATGQLVFKEYHPGKAPRPGDVLGLIALRDQLAPADRARLDTIAAWPLRAVLDGGALLGLVVQRIPDSFFHSARLPMSGRSVTLAREVQHLFVDRRHSRLGMPEPTWEQRLTICRDFAAALDFLHGPAVDVVFGDINARNELFRLDDEPAVLFVDCDSARRRGSVTGEPQLDAPDWKPPGHTPLNRSTDRYKLALFVLRCLIPPGEQTSTCTDPAAADGVLDADGRALLDAALLGPANERPAAEDWLRYLSRQLGAPIDAPRLADVALDRTLVPAGEAVVLAWAAVDAFTVEVTAPGAAPVSVDGRPGAGRVRLVPARSGPIAVVARNDQGTDERRSEPVAVYEVPDFSALPVPLPRVPVDRLHLPELPDLGSVLALYPPVPDPPPAALTGVTAPAEAPATDDPLPYPPVRLPGLDLYDTGPIDVVGLMLSGPGDPGVAP